MFNEIIRVWYMENGKLKYMDFDPSMAKIIEEIFGEDEIVTIEVILGE